MLSLGLVILIIERDFNSYQPEFGRKLKNSFFAKFCLNFLAFSPFLALCKLKIFKKHFSTSVWNGQHPDAGQNIQQRVVFNIISDHSQSKSYKLLLLTEENFSLLTLFDKSD